MIFFARYEASQFGSPYIETEHLLLGMLREDKRFSNKLLTFERVEEIRKMVELRTVVRERVSTSADLPQREVSNPYELISGSLSNGSPQAAWS